MSYLYNEMILEHSSKPRFYEKLDVEPTVGFSPLCGDDYLLYKKDSLITFQGHGCAISKASFSIMATMINGHTDEFNKDLCEKAISSIMTGFTNDSKLRVFSDVHKYPARVKCATLAWRTLQESLNGKG